MNFSYSSSQARIAGVSSSQARIAGVSSSQARIAGVGDLPLVVIVAFISLLAMGSMALADGMYQGITKREAMTGVGIQVGTTGGLTVYQDLDDEHFVEAVLGTYWYNGFYAAGDYCYQYPGAFKTAPMLTPFFGVGPMLATGTSWRHDHNYTAIGMHIPLGVNLHIPKTPIQVHFHIGPAMMITPYTDTFLDAVLGVRFLF